jgi:hypothetical protein
LHNSTNNQIHMKTSIKAFGLVVALSAWGLQQATAQVTGVNLGTGLPPATLGGYTMSTFDPGLIGGQSYYEAMVNGSGEGALHPGEGEWATWGQNYSGNVYVALGQSTLTLTLSGTTEAVYFYEEPNVFADFLMTATDSSGATVTTTINGDHGSAGVGFYEDVPGGPYLTKITVTSADTSGFAIGEFGINGGSLSGSVGTPDGGSTLLLMALGLGGLFALTRFSRTVAV